MDTKNANIVDDLRGLGDVHVDELTRAIYATDASLLQVMPLAVVAPKSIESLAAIVQYASDQGLSIHPRGSGTGLAGESLGKGLVVDVSRYLTRILEIGEQSVRVEPGARYAHVQAELAKVGRMLAVDPISGDRCTLGGMLATNAAGPHALRYGTTRDYVLDIKGVLADGSFANLSVTPVVETRSETDALATIVRQIARVLSANAREIQEEQPLTLAKHGGYELRGVLQNKIVHLPRLLAGSEGTLAVSAEIQLATVPIPPFRGILIATFPNLQSAANAVVESLEYQPTACEMVDRRILKMIRESNPWFRSRLSNDAEAMLLIEHEGNSPDNVAERILLNQNRLNRVKRLTLDTHQIYDAEGIALCWKVRDRTMPKLASITDNVQPLPFIENTAVPPSRLPEFLARVQSIMRRHDVTATYASHAGQGILHTRPLLDLNSEGGRRKIPVLAEEVFQAAMDLGGTFHGEHGAGLLRSPWLARQFPKLYPAFKRIKEIFDPGNTLNPGRIVTEESSFPSLMLRGASKLTDDNPTRKPFLRWPSLNVRESSERCNGCGACQTASASSRMCPTYRANHLETSSPRSLINVIRTLREGNFSPEVATSPEFAGFLRTCVHCKMCASECPSSVDVSKLAVEAKAAHLAETGMSREDWFFSQWGQWSNWAGKQAHFVNSLLGQPGSRWLLEKTLGLSRRRRLYRFHHRSFVRRSGHFDWTIKPSSRAHRTRVALFADSFTNENDPELGVLMGRVLEHHGYIVHVPPSQRASGFSSLQYGDVESARQAVVWNFEIAAELVREGFTIIATEPSAALMLRDEASNFFVDPAHQAVSQATFEFTEFMAMLADRGELLPPRDPVPLSVGYHEPCHLRALAPRHSPTLVLKSISELRLVEMELGCSGMAVTHGLHARNHDSSLRAGSAMLDRLSATDLQIGTTQCGFCRMQMETGVDKPTIHPAKLLALAYRLVEQPSRLFRRPRGELLAP